MWAPTPAFGTENEARPPPARRQDESGTSAENHPRVSSPHKESSPETAMTVMQCTKTRASWVPLAMR